MERHATHARLTNARHSHLLVLTAALGVLAAACAGTGDAIEGDDVAASQQELSRVPVATQVTTTLKDPGTIVVYFQCGWDPKSLSAQCTCHGDADCNRMFTSGFCGANASCDSGAGTCSCDLKL